MSTGRRVVLVVSVLLLVGTIASALDGEDDAPQSPPASRSTPIATSTPAVTSSDVCSAAEGFVVVFISDVYGSGAAAGSAFDCSRVRASSRAGWREADVRVTNKRTGDWIVTYEVDVRTDPGSHPLGWEVQMLRATEAP